MIGSAEEITKYLRFVLKKHEQSYDKTLQDKNQDRLTPSYDGILMYYYFSP